MKTHGMACPRLERPAQVCSVCDANDAEIAGLRDAVIESFKNALVAAIQETCARVADEVCEATKTKSPEGAYIAEVIADKIRELKFS